MPRSASTVTFGELLDAAIRPEDLAAFWTMGKNLSSDQKRTMREMVMGSNHTSAWNMVQDVARIVEEGGNREAKVRFSGKLTLDGVRAAMEKYVQNKEPLPTVEGAPAADNSASPSAPSASPSASPSAPAAASNVPPQGVSPNIIAAVTGLYEDQSQTFETVNTGDDFRMLLWGNAPENLRSEAEVRIISDALGTLTKTADAAAVIRSILTAAGIDDAGTLAAMRQVNPSLVTSQHGRAADSLFHLNLIAAQLKGYEGLIRDEEVSILRKSRQRREVNDAEKAEARLNVAVQTLGDLLDSLERESNRWTEYENNRKAQKDREEVAQNGGDAVQEKLPYASLSESGKAILTEEDWNDLPAAAQEKLLNRWKDAPEAAPETSETDAASVAEEGANTDQTPEETAAEVAAALPEDAPETPEAAPETAPRRSRK